MRFRGVGLMRREMYGMGEGSDGDVNPGIFCECGRRMEEL